MNTNNFFMEIKTEGPSIKIGIDASNIWTLEIYFPVLFSPFYWREGGSMTILIRTFLLSLILLEILIIQSNIALVSLKLSFSWHTKY